MKRTVVIASLGIASLHAWAQAPVPMAVLPPDQMPAAAKFAGPQDPAYVARTPKNTAPRRMEKLGRGVAAVRASEGQIWVTWRLLGTEPDETAFNVYRVTDGGTPAKLNAAPI